MQTEQERNRFLAKNLRIVGNELEQAGDNFEERMTALQTLTAGLVSSICLYHQECPVEHMELFFEEVRTRIQTVVYGTRH